MPSSGSTSTQAAFRVLLAIWSPSLQPGHCAAFGPFAPPGHSLSHTTSQLCRPTTSSDFEFHQFFLSSERLQPIKRYSPYLFMAPDKRSGESDMGLGNHLEALLLLSLSRISINPDQDAVCNEPLSSVMSRLGFHTATVDGSTFVSCSRYRILALGNPCAAIAYDSDSGNRLELGGFNILGYQINLFPSIKKVCRIENLWVK